MSENQDQMNEKPEQPEEQDQNDNEKITEEENIENFENQSDNQKQSEEKEKQSDASADFDENEMDKLGEYCPFIADVPITSYADPFPIPNPDTRTDEELNKVKKTLRRIVRSKKFDPPIPLSDFCLIAKERWEQEEDESEASIGLCLLI